MRVGMHHEARLEVVPHATHLFVEPGALEQVHLALSGTRTLRLPCFRAGAPLRPSDPNRMFTQASAAAGGVDPF